jgi:hypothetical protein
MDVTCGSVFRNNKVFLLEEDNTLDIEVRSFVMTY